MGMLFVATALHELLLSRKKETYYALLLDEGNNAVRFFPVGNQAIAAVPCRENFITSHSYITKSSLPINFGRRGGHTNFRIHMRILSPATMANGYSLNTMNRNQDHMLTY